MYTPGTYQSSRYIYIDLLVNRNKKHSGKTLTRVLIIDIKMFRLEPNASLKSF